MIFLRTMAYDMPLCQDEKSNVCYMDGNTRNCDGYLKIENIQKPKYTVGWNKVGQKEYLIVKDPYDYQMAKKFCTSLCSELYFPEDVADTKNHVTYNAWKNGVYTFFIGLVVMVSTENVTFYSSYDDVNPLSESQISGFRDVYFDTALDFSKPGTYPLLIDASDLRYNTFKVADLDGKHSFVCEGRPNVNDNGNLTITPGTQNSWLIGSLLLNIYLSTVIFQSIP